jgi:hypothetical protein
MKELSREKRKRFPGAIRRDRGGQRGATLVELALLLPILVVMVLGIIDFGRLIHARLVITNVSREGGSIGSRADQQGNQQLITALQHSAAPFTINGADGRIFITRIDAGPNALAPQPFIAWRETGGALNEPSRITGNVGQTPGGLANPLFGRLQFNTAQNDSDIAEVTIVEVFYLYRPITPLPAFIQNLVLPSRGGIVIGSRATF